MRKTISWSESYNSPADAEFENWIQAKGDLGERMSECIHRAIMEGGQKVILFGTDIPGLTVEIIEKGFAALNEVQAVLGPSSDGGYYLAGTNKITPELFPPLEWGTTKVLKETIQSLISGGISYELLPELDDIDTIEDWLKYQNQ